ncbi:MAG TPA: alpha/beta fold hydrolase [Nitrososphaeraceae archaeon]|nr:alpha/beta fold hydrolase [Nitrososphaeraceae archaeon]
MELMYFTGNAEIENPTILLLHGYPASSHMYRNLIKELEDEYHIIAPDYPGFGNSDQLPINKFEIHSITFQM